MPTPHGERNLIQRGDLLQRLLRGLEIKGQRAASLTLDPNVVPMVLLEDLQEESQFLEPKSPGWFWSERPPAVVGQLSGAGISNGNENVIVVVQRVCVTAGASLDFDLFSSTNAGAEGALATQAFTSWADTRRAGTPPQLAIMGASAGGVAPVQNVFAKLRWVAGGNMSEFITQPIIIGPGSALVLQCTTAAAAFECGFSGKVMFKA